MSMRDTMLGIAREAIMHRASLDGCAPEEYNPAKDEEGYIVSLLIALRHWSTAHNLDWQAELHRAQELFEEDLQEEEENRNASQNDKSARAKSMARRTAEKIFEIVCESDWPEEPDAWPGNAILHVLKKLRHQRPQRARKRRILSRKSARPNFLKGDTQR